MIHSLHFQDKIKILQDLVFYINPTHFSSKFNLIFYSFYTPLISKHAITST